MVLAIVLAYLMAKFFQDKKLLHRTIILTDDLSSYQENSQQFILTVFTGSRPFSGINHVKTSVRIRLIGNQGKGPEVLLNFADKTLKRASVEPELRKC